MLRLYVLELKKLIKQGDITPDSPIINEVKKDLVQLLTLIEGRGERGMIEAKVNNAFEEGLRF